MPAITDRSNAEPLVKTKSLNHGTLGCTDIARTRRFYEEVLGLECIQTSAMSMMVSKNVDYVYAVVESPTHTGDMHMLNHNGLEVETDEEVNEAHRVLMSIKDEWGIKVMPPRNLHGSHACYFKDFDGNWWEIVSAGKRGYIGEFRDPESDITGLHELDDFVEAFTKDNRVYNTSDPETRKLIRERLGRGDGSSH